MREDRTEFSAKVKAQAFERSGGFCEKLDAEGKRCGLKLQTGKFRYDHILPDWLGGEATLENCCVQCLACDAPKTAADQTRIAKTKRQHLAHIGAKARKGRPIPGSKASGISKKFSGEVVRR